ncbi:hypothetical protein FEM48_Zijuj08G0052200 [Ziziphus jujuba var. spinosa]|uniref:NAD-dependent epimerase/dehydratase domain-containing protein n=1 Tax=Ziziphus jujuba var. spinosa TaxID=714518 RepID=A0A978UX65_ZIZJJ|nr:hypothetical protein FEM48_Zijuj08G0052200 [Ziziphus jujuba var. spinosa]
MEEEEGRGRTVCVTGGTGYIASWLIMRLLHHGYSVRATVRSPHPECKRDLSYLTHLPGASQIFQADLNQPHSFNEAIQGCTAVFHLAHPMDTDQAKEPEETVTRRAVEGTVGILKACLENKKTLKRVVYTSSGAATILYNDKGLSVSDENTWSELDVCRSSKLVSPSYLVSKTVVEKMALEFAENNGLDLVTLVLPPSNHDQYECLVNSYMVHIDDVANALIFLLEYPHAQGRYICSSAEITIREMFDFLIARYPEFQISIPG